MDRDRLKEVHQTDLNESKINEDFVEWLKTKGPSYLLVVLIVFAAWLLLVRFKQQKQDHLNAGWSAFISAQLPGSLEDVAVEYADISGLSELANLRAADIYLQAVVTQVPLGTDPSASVVDPLTLDDREDYLARADRIYQAVVDADEGSLGHTLYAIAAMNGKAAVAESRGESEEARQWYQKAAERGKAHFPRLATRAEELAETVDRFSQPIVLPAETDLPPVAALSNLERATIDRALRDLIQSGDSTNAFLFPPPAP